MKEFASSALEVHAASHGGWTACLRKGPIEIWFAGGPGIGRLGYTLTSKVAANAAIDLEYKRQNQRSTIERERDRWKVVFRHRHTRVGVTVEELPGEPQTQTVTISYDGDQVGTLVAVYEDSDLRFNGKVYSEVTDAQESARTLAGLLKPKL